MMTTSSGFISSPVILHHQKKCKKQKIKKKKNSFSNLLVSRNHGARNQCGCTTGRRGGREGGLTQVDGHWHARAGTRCTVHWLKGETLTVTAVEPIIGSFEVMVLSLQAKDRLPVTVRGTLFMIELFPHALQCPDRVTISTHYRIEHHRILVGSFFRYR